MLPGYFALVMSTGMVSVGLRLIGLDQASVVVLWIAIASFVVLLGATAVRVVRYPRDAYADLRDPERAFGFFTFVAATDVLGTRLVHDGHDIVAGGMLAVALSVWLLLGYVIPTLSVLGNKDLPVLRHANGTWFIWAVASQSVAVLAATLQPTGVPGSSLLSFVAIFSWALGAFLYAVVGVLLIVRLGQYAFTPADITPPYWVAMGATAITVLAGSRIVDMTGAPSVDVTRSLVAGLSLLFWGFGTWLIPALLAVGWWRHITHRVPMSYTPAWWSMVFPIAMYGVGSYFLGEADHLPIVMNVGRVVIYIAVAVWLTVFVSMLRHLLLPAPAAAPVPVADTEPAAAPVPVADTEPGSR